MIVVIDGWWGSGKSVLRGLLDGHPDLFVCPVQDSIVGAFARDWETRPWMAYRDTEQLRKLLASLSQYYRIERFSFNRRMHLDFSADDRAYIDIDVDFAAFDRAMIESVLAMPEWSAQAICQTIYRTLLEHWRGYPADPSRVAHHVTAENNRSQTLRQFPDLLPDGKLLYCLRSPAGIIATRAHRRPVKEDFRTAAGQDRAPMDLIRDGEARRITERTRLARAMADAHPDRVMLLRFEDIVENVEPTMRRVAAFLDIPFDPSLTFFSHLGREVRTSEGKAYVGQIHDRPQDLLSDDEQRLIALEENRRRCLDPRRWPSPAAWGVALRLMIRGLFQRSATPRNTQWQPGEGPPPT